MTPHLLVRGFYLTRAADGINMIIPHLKEVTMGARIALVLALIGAAAIALLPRDWEAFLYIACGFPLIFGAAMLGKWLARRTRRP